MATPWSVEFNENELMLGELIIEVGIGQDHNTIVHFCTKGERKERGQNTEQTNLLHLYENINKLM